VTLRCRLLLALAAMVIVVGVSAAGLLVVLRTSLRTELDRQVEAAVRELVDCRPGGEENPAPGAARDLTGRVVDQSAFSAAGGCGAPAAFAGEPSARLPPAVVDERATGPEERLRPFDAEAGGRRFRAAAVLIASGRVVVAALPTDHIDATFRRTALGAAAGGGVVVVVAGLLAGWVERLGLRPIRAVAAAAQAIAAGDTARRADPAPTGTEAAELGRSFNLMADGRQDAEDRLRHFIADASHELRTPLTTVTAVFEMHRSGALVGTDLDEAMARAGAEASRMIRLVEELLVLAQLDHQRPLARDSVDLAALVGDALTDIGVLQPDRPVHAELTSAVVRGDELRLRQVVANLVANALAHTTPSTPLHLSVYGDGHGRLLVVGDEGPGLSPAEASRVFDRFVRAGRHRTAGGTGLGLSIVRSIVEAHGGSIRLDAAPGQGCVFTVWLPANFEPA